MAKGRVGSAGRGRIRFVLVLLGFLVIAVGVILRRSYGIASARELQDLDARHAALMATRLRLEGDVRAAASRSPNRSVRPTLGGVDWFIDGTFSAKQAPGCFVSIRPFEDPLFAQLDGQNPKRR